MYVHYIELHTDLCLYVHYIELHTDLPNEIRVCPCEIHTCRTQYIIHMSRTLHYSQLRICLCHLKLNHSYLHITNLMRHPRVTNSSLKSTTRMPVVTNSIIHICISRTPYSICHKLFTTVKWAWSRVCSSIHHALNQSSTYHKLIQSFMTIHHMPRTEAAIHVYIHTQTQFMYTYTHTHTHTHAQTHTHTHTHVHTYVYV